MSTEPAARPDPSAPTMRAVRLQPPGGLDALTVEEIGTPRPEPGEALVRVHAAAITRDELDGRLDRLPATPSYELSGDRRRGRGGRRRSRDRRRRLRAHGLRPRRRRRRVRSGPGRDPRAEAADARTHESAALPLAALSAWQGLFVHGGLQAGERVLIHGAAGGVGHFAVQLARWRGAHVIGTTSGAGADLVRGVRRRRGRRRTTAIRGRRRARRPRLRHGREATRCERSAAIRARRRLVSIAEEPPPTSPRGRDHVLRRGAGSRPAGRARRRIADEGALRPAIDSVFPLADARAAFERSIARGKRGKVVLRVVHD